MAAARAKRQRTAGGPPLPSDECLQSPPLANGGSGAGAAEGAGPVERELFEESSGEAPHGDTSGGRGDPAAREARLQAIRAKFGTRRFLPARELPAAEQRQQLGAAESDLSPEDYKLLRWDALPVVLSGTSNGWAKNWVLTGQSGCVGLASSLQHLWVLGAGQTIFVEAADAVHAVRDDAGVAVRLGTDGWLTLKVPDAEAAADMIAAINGRAATRAALRQRAGGAPAAAGQGGTQPAGSPAAAAGPAAGTGARQSS
ncbi:elongation factor Ts [Chlorella sorokiniana]|uniref:Elongation factor Ts n=1 Tax=Chlorella sorokiniana TaxID=3076 RepID=A0A2P6TVP7_CHLSO|nr:elongation factor Ts [Chlorella sorokiniana]|eukprot:PRW58137.1 elongation factor Ts [Chlorella sorokiniana]